MAKQINPSLARIWQDHNQRRYGATTSNLVSVNSEAEHRALDLLETGLTNAQFENLDVLAKIERRDLDPLLARLGPLLTHTSHFLPELSAQEVEQRFAEILRLYSTGVQDPARLMKLRSSQTIFVSDLSVAGLIATRALFTIGFGSVITFDATRVRSKDTAQLGYPAELIGATRHQAACQLLGKTKSELRLHTRRGEGLEAVSAGLLLDNDVVDPELYQPWMNRETPHIAVCFTELGASVSQLVLPGQTACLACSEVGKMDRDPDWVKVATQLNQLDRNFADSSSLLTSLGLAIQRIALQLAGQEVSGGALEYQAKTGQVVELEPVTRNCGCR